MTLFENHALGPSAKLKDRMRATRQSIGAFIGVGPHSPSRATISRANSDGVKENSPERLLTGMFTKKPTCTRISMTEPMGKPMEKRQHSPEHSNHGSSTLQSGSAKRHSDSRQISDDDSLQMPVDAAKGASSAQPSAPNADAGTVLEGSSVSLPGHTSSPIDSGNLSPDQCVAVEKLQAQTATMEAHLRSQSDGLRPQSDGRKGHAEAKGSCEAFTDIGAVVPQSTAHADVDRRTTATQRAQQPQPGAAGAERAPPTSHG